MILCDIGNTSYHFLDGDISYKENANIFNPKAIKEKVYYISVNTAVSEKLTLLDNWIDLAAFIDMSKYYETMGIDRIVAVEALKNAVVVDAGSAITVDVLRDGVFMGGFIYPGVQAMRKTYENISPALSCEFNFDLSLDVLAKNTQDAISYGFLKTLYSEVISYKLPIILTGGDAHKLKKLFKEATVNEELIFDSMKEILRQFNNS